MQYHRRRSRNPSDVLWMPYLEQVGEEDRELSERWKGDAGSIIVFSGLFSAVVAAFIIESYKSLSPDSAQQTVLLLTELPSQLAAALGNDARPPFFEPPFTFQPSTSALRINILWFTSLIVTLTCALAAAETQQLARDYQQSSRWKAGTPYERAQIRIYMFEGVERFGMSRAFEVILAMLHAAVFIFFAGLVEFTISINTTVGYIILGIACTLACAYFIITMFPIAYPNSPFRTPLSGLLWFVAHAALMGTMLCIAQMTKVFGQELLPLKAQDIPHSWLKTVMQGCRKRLAGGMWRTIVDYAASMRGQGDVHALEKTIDSLDDDEEEEEFLSGIPAFAREQIHSKVVLMDLTNPARGGSRILGKELIPTGTPPLPTLIRHLLESCTSGSGRLTESERGRRLLACITALWQIMEAYNGTEGPWRPWPVYMRRLFANPSFVRALRTEQDKGVVVIGRCMGALIARRLIRDMKSPKAMHDEADSDILAELLEQPLPNVMKYLADDSANLANLVGVVKGIIPSFAQEPLPTEVPYTVSTTVGILCKGLSTGDCDPRVWVSFFDTWVDVEACERGQGSCLEMNPNYGPRFTQLADTMGRGAHMRFRHTFLTQMLPHPDRNVAVIRRCVGALIARRLIDNTIRDIKPGMAQWDGEHSLFLSELLEKRTPDVRRYLDGKSAYLANIVSVIKGITPTLDSQDTLSTESFTVILRTLRMLCEGMWTVDCHAEIWVAFFYIWVDIELREQRKGRHSDLDPGVASKFGTIAETMAHTMRQQPGSGFLSDSLPTHTDRRVIVIWRCMRALIARRLIDDIKSTAARREEDVGILAGLLDESPSGTSKHLGDQSAHLANLVGAIKSITPFLAQDPLSAESLGVAFRTLKILCEGLWNTDCGADVWASFFNVWADVEERRVRHSDLDPNVAPRFTRLAETIGLAMRQQLGGTFMTRLLPHADPRVSIIRRCVGALVARRLIRDIKSGAVQCDKANRQILAELLGERPSDVSKYLDDQSVYFANIISVIKSVIPSLAQDMLSAKSLTYVFRTLKVLREGLQAADCDAVVWASFFAVWRDIHARETRQEPYSEMDPIFVPRFAQVAGFLGHTMRQQLGGTFLAGLLPDGGSRIAVIKRCMGALSALGRRLMRGVETWMDDPQVGESLSDVIKDISSHLANLVTTLQDRTTEPPSTDSDTLNIVLDTLSIVCVGLRLAEDQRQIRAANRPDAMEVRSRVGSDMDDIYPSQAQEHSLGDYPEILDPNYDAERFIRLMELLHSSLPEFYGVD